MIKRVTKTPRGVLRQLSPERSDKAGENLNPSWFTDLDGEEVNFDETVDDVDDNDLNLEDDDGDDEYGETYYSDDFEDDDEEEEDDEITSEVVFRTIRLDNGLRVLVPEDIQNVSGDLCKIEILSAERRTELLSDFKHLTDDIVISDAYEVKDPGSCSPITISRSKLIFPVVLPTTRLKHDELFRFHVMAKERNGNWKKVPADYQNSELTFPLSRVHFFIAYAQPIPEFTNVTSSGFTFKSAKNEQISVEIPKGAVDGGFTMEVKVHPVNMDRMNAYRAFDPRAIDGIYSLTDILYVRHTMDTVLQREGSVRLPLDRVARDHELKCLTKTLGNYEIVDVDKVQAVRNGQLNIPYRGNHTSFQVACVRPGASEDKIRRDAAYLTGQVDSCTILFFLSKKNKERYLTVDFVDRTVEENVHRNRCKSGFYEIKNSRCSGVELGQKKRIRVDLGGNMHSAECRNNTQFTFVYSSGCKNNSIYFRTAKNPYGHYFSIVKVLFDDKKVHEIHFSYPCVGQKLDAINNFYVHSIYRRTCNSVFAAKSSSSGYNTDRRGISNPDPLQINHKTTKPLPETDLKLVPKLEAESESEQKAPVNIFDSGYNTERTGISKSDSTLSWQQTEELIPNIDPTLVCELESELEPKPIPKPEQVAKPVSKPELVPNQETNPEPESELNPEPESEVNPEPESELNPESDPHQEPESEPHQEPEPKPEYQSKPELKQESISKPEALQKPKPKSDLIPNQRQVLSRNPPPFLAQRPSSATTDKSSIPERDHPLLQDASLLMLGENLPPEDVIKLMTLADFKLHEINRIRRTAPETRFDPNMLLLEAWRRKKKSFLELSDISALRCLEKDLKEIGRPDVAKILKRLRKKENKRVLRKKDFLNL